MKVRIVYAVRAPAAFVPFWLVDTCAGGKWDADRRSAKTWPSREELLAEFAATELEPPAFALGVVEVIELVEVAR